MAVDALVELMDVVGLVEDCLEEVFLVVVVAGHTLYTKALAQVFVLMEQGKVFVYSP